MSQGYRNRESERRDCCCDRRSSCKSNFCQSEIPSCCGEDRFGFFNKYGTGGGNNNFIWIIVAIIVIFFLRRDDHDDDEC